MHQETPHHYICLPHFLGVERLVNGQYPTLFSQKLVRIDRLGRPTSEVSDSAQRCRAWRANLKSVGERKKKPEKEFAMSFGLYAIGFAIMICGLIYGAHLMHMPAHWIAVCAIVLLGVGILSGVKATRQKDSVD
jgi:hypothetical protein